MLNIYTCFILAIILFLFYNLTAYTFKILKACEMPIY